MYSSMHSILSLLLTNKQRGFGLAQYAEAMHGVMTALGYEEYGMSPSSIEDIDTN